MTKSNLGLTTRYIVLAPDDHSIRGARAEFLHFGFPVTRYEEPLGALADLAQDAHATLIVAAEPEMEQTEHILELACAIPDRSVYLAIHDGISHTALNNSVRDNVRGILSLPLTPHGLSEALPTMRLADRVIQLKDLSVHLDEQSVSWQGRTIVLPAREFLLLSHIARAYPNTILLETLSAVYGADPKGRKSSVRAAIARLRKRLRSLDPAADFIQTIKFAGYYLSA